MAFFAFPPVGVNIIQKHIRKCLEGDKIDKDILAYRNGEINVIKGVFIISRETTTRGAELIHIIHVNDNEEQRELYDNLWHNSSKKNKNKTPKHSGGKKPYVMLMVQKIVELQKQGIKDIEDAIGFLILLSDNIEWNTGRVINKRNKKSLKYNDLKNKYTGSKHRFEQTMKLLTNNNLLVYKPEGYFISRDLIKKGATRKGGD